MSKIKLVTDTGCDLPPVELENVVVVPYEFSLQGSEEVYSDDKRISSKRLLQFLNLGIKGDVVGIDNDLEINGEDSYLFLPSHLLDLSDTSFRETIYKYYFSKDFNSKTSVSVYNTGLTSGALGMLIENLNNMIEAGCSYSELIDYINTYRYKFKSLLIPDDNYIDLNKIKNSRKAKMAKLFGNDMLLSIERNGLVADSFFNKNTRRYIIDRILEDKAGDIVLSCPDDQIRNPFVAELVSSTTDVLDVKMSNTNIISYGPKSMVLSYREK